MVLVCAFGCKQKDEGCAGGSCAVPVSEEVSEDEAAVSPEQATAANPDDSTGAVIDFATLVEGDDPDGHKARTAYEKLLKSKTPVFIKWGAAWCPNCTHVIPVLEKLAAEFKGKVMFVEVNLDNFVTLANRIGIEKIPALFLINNKNVIWQEVGAKNIDVLRKTIKEKAGVS